MENKTGMLGGLVVSRVWGPKGCGLYLRIDWLDVGMTEKLLTQTGTLNQTQVSH